MDKILEHYEQYSYAKKVLISAESESKVRIMGWVFTFICHISFLSATGYGYWHHVCAPLYIIELCKKPELIVNCCCFRASHLSFFGVV
jgi:hypothetical protein